jgi:hypothetical protein
MKGNVRSKRKNKQTLLQHYLLQASPNNFSTSLHQDFTEESPKKITYDLQSGLVDAASSVASPELAMTAYCYPRQLTIQLHPVAAIDEPKGGIKEKKEVHKKQNNIPVNIIVPVHTNDSIRR